MAHGALRLVELLAAGWPDSRGRQLGQQPEVVFLVEVACWQQQCVWQLMADSQQWADRLVYICTVCTWKLNCCCGRLCLPGLVLPMEQAQSLAVDQLTQ
jgi:hypothetical protein